MAKHKQIVISSETPEDRAKRKLLRNAIRRDAERKIAEIHTVPTGKALFAPRVLFAAFIMLAAIGAVLVGKTTRSVENNRPIPHMTALKSLNALATALGRYRFHVGVFPSTEQGLKVLIEDPGEPGWRGPYIIQLMTDPWDTPYFYELSPSNTVKLITCGPDKVPGTKDDLFPDPDCFNPGTDWTNGWLDAKDRLPVLNPRDQWIRK